MPYRLTHLALLLALLLIASGVDARAAAVGSPLPAVAASSVGGEAQKAKKGKKKSKGKKSDEEEVDPFTLSLDQNLVIPAIPAKRTEALKAHMEVLGKTLAQPAVARIEKMRAGEVIVATISTDLLFAPNDTVLTASAAEVLTPYRSLLGRGLYKLVLACHTDDTGSTFYTDRLSEARAAAVEAWLTRDMTAASAMVVPYALGSAEPLCPNDSQANRARNRRIEIFIIPLLPLLNQLP